MNFQDFSTKQSDSLIHPKQWASVWMARVESFLDRRSVLALGLVAGTLGILKAGLSGIDPIMWSPESWPEPDGRYPHLSYGIRTIAYLLGASEPQDFTNIGYGLIAATILLLAGLLALTFRNDVGAGRLAAMMLLSGPPIWVLAGRVGHPDVFILLGGAIIGLKGRRSAWVVLGTLLCVLGAPEQALLVAASMVLLSLASTFREYRRGALLSLGLAIAAWLGLNYWSFLLGKPSRGSILIELLPGAIERFFIQFPIILYAGFGISLLVIAWLCVSTRKRDTAIILTSVILIPLIATAATGDQGRVLVSISFAATCAIVLNASGSFLDFFGKRLAYPMTLVALLVLYAPAIDVTGNKVRSPWALYYPYIQAYLLDNLPL